MEGSFSKWNTTLQDLSRIRAEESDGEDAPSAAKYSWFDQQESPVDGIATLDPLLTGPGQKESARHFSHPITFRDISTGDAILPSANVSSNAAHADSVSFLLNTTPSEPPVGRYDPFFKVVQPPERSSVYSNYEHTARTPPTSVLDSFVGSSPLPVDEEDECFIDRMNAGSIEEEENTHMQILLDKLNQVFTPECQEESPSEWIEEKQLLSRLEQVFSVPCSSNSHDQVMSTASTTIPPKSHLYFEMIKNRASPTKGPLRPLDSLTKSLKNNVPFPIIEYESILVTEEEKEIEGLADMISDKYLSVPYLDQITRTTIHSTSV